MLTKACVRGCGTRKAGHCYICCGSSVNGRPIEYFILDPMIPYSWEWQRGYKLFEKDGITHVFIFIGESFYKSLWDYVEETRLYGASRRVSDNFPFERLTAGQSKMVFLHRKGIPKFEFVLDREAPLQDCKIVDEYKEHWAGYHPKDETVCTFSHKDLSLFLHNPKDIELADDARCFQVNMPSFSYEGISPQWVSVDQSLIRKDDNWQIGAFLALPISHIEIPYKDNMKVREKANKANFDVFNPQW
jgi:hypothetical protein